MKTSICICVVALLLAGSTRLRSASPDPRDPPPGVLNSFTGDVWINGAQADGSSDGRAALEAGQEIATHNGMAELLLTPGSFVRLGAGSVLQLESTQAPGVRLRLKRGRAVIEILTSQPPIVVEERDATATFQKPGLYGFDTKRGEIAVYSGEALVEKGFGVKTRGLPADPLIAWSNLRSEQLSRESAAAAQTVTDGSGWLWDPWARSYTWLSASGAVTGPFGWPYYSPGYVPNAIPVHRGDSYLYGPPVIQTPGVAPAAPDYTRPAPAVPLTAPGVPQFPNNKF